MLVGVLMVAGEIPSFMHFLFFGRGIDSGKTSSFNSFVFEI
jgi:hypothetical protein